MVSARCLLAAFVLATAVSVLSGASSEVGSGVEAPRVGSFVEIDQMVEKVFVSTDGDVEAIHAGGIVTANNGDGTSNIFVKVEGPSDVSDVVYQLLDSRLLPPKLKMVCPTLVETDTCDIGDVGCMTRSLFANGYVVSRGPVAGFPTDGAAGAFAEQMYANMTRLAAEAGLDHNSLDFHFADVASRGPGRWEMLVGQKHIEEPREHVESTAPTETIESSELTEASGSNEPLFTVPIPSQKPTILKPSSPLQAETFKPSQRSAVGPASPVWLTQLWERLEAEVIGPALRDVAEMHLGRSPASPYPDIYRSQGCEGALRDPQFTTLFDGVLMSVPGADTQHWHRDSGVNTECLSHVSVYVSTSNVEQAMGPTQFLPGTNLDFGFQFSEWTGFFNHCPDMRAPLLPAGGMLIWEYRTLHRGTRNVHASKRPMLYKIYRLKDTWRDVNMGQKSFYSRVSQAQ
mmetsp:Transcript_4360/g.9791  ORF Transcript_4360/g.9791 Transcript_4360/m.9791 type:complete len:458 (-) Transcript_4360:2649-4022(-)